MPKRLISGMLSSISEAELITQMAAMEMDMDTDTDSNENLTLHDRDSGKSSASPTAITAANPGHPTNKNLEDSDSGPDMLV